MIVDFPELVYPIKLTLYISDPLRNIFMFYNKENLNFKGLRKDLKKVLKISQIG